MIKANELRIGNKLLHHGKIISVSGITDETDTYNDCFLIWYEGLAYNISEFSQIPLTPEILERCKLGDEISLYPYAYSGFGIQIEGFTDQGINVSIKYLHQLQNAYFVLMDEELEIKELQHA